MSAQNLLNIGHSGLSSSRKKLSTSGHNIANANTEGYSRQRAIAKTKTPIGHGSLVLGTGAEIDRVERFHDKFLERKLNLSLTDHNYHKERNFQLTQVEDVFNEINSEGFANVLNQFFNSFRELSKSPDDETIRSVVRDSANIIVRDFKSTKKRLNEIQDGMNKRLESAVMDINALAYQVAKLNVRITEIENAHGETGDLRDQRDLAVRKLSEFFEVTTFTNEKNEYTVNIEGIGTLVSGGHQQELTVQRSSESKAHVPGGAEIFFKGRGQHKISHRFNKGQVQAILKTRNNELKHLQEKMDNLAFDLANAVNAIHRKGFANHKVPLDEMGNPRPDLSATKVTNIDFFKTPTERFGAAELIELSDDVKSDLKNIVTAWKPNSPGDNRIAIAITRLQGAKVLDGGTSTFEESYTKGIGKIGIETAKARVDEQHSLGMVAQNTAIRERVSGVSIDEETANMVQYQHVFDASARVMSVADEMFATVLGIKKL